MFMQQQVLYASCYKTRLLTAMIHRPHTVMRDIRHVNTQTDNMTAECITHRLELHNSVRSWRQAASESAPPPAY